MKKPLNALSLQLSDLLVYMLLPAISVLLPAKVSRSVLVSIAGWQWLLADEAAASCTRAAEYTPIGDRRKWMRRWRLVVMLEARDLSLILWGRGRSVYGEIAEADEITRARDRVLIGMHWGPSIAILGLLQSRGLSPLLIYRPVERSILKQRPWYYFFLTRSVRYIHRACGDRAITIGGAGAALERELARPGSSVVVLDAPPAPGRSTIGGTVMGMPVKFNAGFPGILENSGREYLFYAISLDQSGAALKTLKLDGPARLHSEDRLISDYCDFLAGHLRSDSAQWRIWGAADQFFQATSKEAMTGGEQG